MKRLCLSLIVVLVISSCLACTNFGKQNEMYFDDFEEVFINKLPEETKDPSLCCDLYINKEKGVLSDPNYVLSFTLKFENYDEFEKHLESFDVSLAENLRIDNHSCYIFQGSIEDFEEYTNEQILDGFFFTYEMITVNEDALEINYLYAHVWDYWKDYFLISKLNSVWGQENRPLVPLSPCFLNEVLL